MGLEFDDTALKIIGTGLKALLFYDSDRVLKQEIYLQEDGTLNIGNTGLTGTSAPSVGGLEPHDLAGAMHTGIIAPSQAPQFGVLLANETIAGTWTFNDIVIADGAYIRWPDTAAITFDNTNHYLEIIGANVGIGTATPQHPLDVVGVTRTSTHIIATGGNVYAGGNNFVFGLDTAEGEHISRSSNDIHHYAGGNVILTIDGDAVGGRVGIGDAYTAPTQLLDLGGAETIYQAFTPSVTNTQWVIGSDGNGFVLYDDSLDEYRMAVGKATEAGLSIGTAFFATGAPANGLIVEGNVGIGTNSPSGRLHIYKGSNDNAEYIFTEASTSTYSTTFNMDNTGLDIGHDSAARALNLITGGNDRLTILGGGNIGINDTTPSYTLDVNGTLRATGVVTIDNSIVVADGGTIGQAAGPLIAFDDTNNYLEVTGCNVGIQTTTPGGTLPTSFENHANSRLLQISTGENNRDAGLFLRRADNVTGLDIWADGSVGDSYIDNRYNNVNGDIFFRVKTAGTPETALTITGGADVGIGTTSPDEKVEILDGSGPQLRLTNTDGVDYANFTVDGDGDLFIAPVTDLHLAPGTGNTIIDSGNFVAANDILTLSGIVIGSAAVSADDGAIVFIERSADPTEPAEGSAVIWMSDGTGKGDDGNILIASQAGGTTKYGTLFDHSAGSAWS